MDSEDLEFYKDLEKAKALSVITARNEEAQRRNFSFSDVPTLVPPPRTKKQQQNIYSCTKSDTNWLKPNVYFDFFNRIYGFEVIKKHPYIVMKVLLIQTTQNKTVSDLNSDATIRSSSVPLVSHPSVEKELIELSPACSKVVSSGLEFDLRQLDPLFQGSFIFQFFVYLA